MIATYYQDVRAGLAFRISWVHHDKPTLLLGSGSGIRSSAAAHLAPGSGSEVCMNGAWELAPVFTIRAKAMWTSASYREDDRRGFSGLSRKPGRLLNRAKRAEVASRGTCRRIYASRRSTGSPELHFPVSHWLPRLASPGLTLFKMQDNITSRQLVEAALAYAISSLFQLLYAYWDPIASLFRWLAYDQRKGSLRPNLAQCSAVAFAVLGILFAGLFAAARDGRPGIPPHTAYPFFLTWKSVSLISLVAFEVPQALMFEIVRLLTHPRSSWS